MLFEFNTNIYDNKSDETFEIDEGFVKGNLFKDEYIGYKDYKPAKIVAKNEQEELLLEIMALSFAINDLNIYLDLHPEDTEMLKRFKELTEKSCEKEMEYVKCYGPLEVMDNESINKFEWINNPWPWENTGGTKYV